MQTHSILLLAIASTALTGFSGEAGAAAIHGQGTWETTLQPRYFDGGSSVDGYYDSALGITWLADANYARTSEYDSGVPHPDDVPPWELRWADANDFVESLSFGSGIDGWRLPHADPINGSTHDFNQSFDGTTDVGFNISAPGTAHAGSGASELAHMYYNTLGNLGFYSVSGSPNQPGWGLTNTGPFGNVSGSFRGYWTGEPDFPVTNVHLAFLMGNGDQFGGYPWASVWPVHDGDVGAAVPTGVPEPGTLALLGLGLLGLDLTRRSRPT